MLSSLNLNSSYTSETDNIYQDFFVPAIEQSIEYRRAVGYFSLGVLLNAPTAMTNIVNNNGKIKLIFSKLVSPQDFDAIKSGMEYSWSDEELPNFQEIIQEHPNTLLEYRIRILAYLFSTKKLEMKIALRPKGMFHQKIGIIKDKDNNTISFNGSMNETKSALHPEYNSEEITVFKSWIAGQEEFVDKHSNDFNKLWQNDKRGSTVTCDLHEVIAEGLTIIDEQYTERPNSSSETKKLTEFLNGKANNNNQPSVPKQFNGKTFKIRDHQREACIEWQNNKYTGILELATGTGKTITSIYAAVKISEKTTGLALIVVVPYVALADQWHSVLNLFNINAIKCYNSKSVWQKPLTDYFSRNTSEQREFVCLVVVNDTFKTDFFQEKLNQFDLDKTMIIGDECHHHGGEGFEDKLPLDAKYKLGLSATPFHYMNEMANERLKKFYEKVVYEYSLYKAIENGILTPYEYFPIPVILTAEETEEYHTISDKIAKAYASQGNKADSNNSFLNALLSERSRLIGTASNKLSKLNELISTEDVPKHSLFYCSDGKVSEDEEYSSNKLNDDPEDIEVKQRIAVANMLRKKRINVSPFTATETKYQRTEIMRMFKDEEIRALIAIRCLDEGIDVPACSTAYLLASSRNPRQFIQRRGRILRKSIGKDKAKIYDFVVVLPLSNLGNKKREVEFFKNELIRVSDFSKHSLNPLTSIKPLKPWLKAYGLQHLVV